MLGTLTISSMRKAGATTASDVLHYALKMKMFDDDETREEY
jgi:hypothetical protein